MEIDQGLGNLRGTWRAPRLLTLGRWKKWTAHVVVGDGPQAGSIKSVKFDHTQPKNPIFRAEFNEIGPTEGSICRGLTIHQELRDRGWFFIDAAYEAEGLTDEYEQWKSYVKACADGGVVIDKEADEHKQLAPGFPDELLPERVRWTARKRDRKVGRWQPTIKTIKQKKPKAQADAAGAA